MLKIKDNVDLEELGFKKDKEDFIYVDDYELMIEEDRKIYSHQFNPDFICGEMRLDRLYDLIQAGLVEKVEE